MTRLILEAFVFFNLSSTDKYIAADSIAGDAQFKFDTDKVGAAVKQEMVGTVGSFSSARRVALLDKVTLCISRCPKRVSQGLQEQVFRRLDVVGNATWLY